MSAKPARKKKKTAKVKKRAPTQSLLRWFPWIPVILGFFLYANTLGHDYTQDDAIVIYDNMFTQQGIKGIPGLIGKDTFFGFFKVEGKSKLVSGGRYRPLTPVMFALEWQLFGRSPFIGHLINILLYAFTGMLLYYFTLFLTRNALKSKATFVALAAAVIYIGHPLHTEVVANIKGRDEIMAFGLSLLALYLLLKSSGKASLKNAVLAGIVFFLALTAKENAVTFLAIVPLTLYFLGEKRTQIYLRRLVPFGIATVAFLLIRAQVIGWDFGGTPGELMNNPFLKLENGLYVAFSGAEKLATILFTLGKYVQLLIFPHPLTHDYYPRHVEIMQFGDWQVLLSLLVYALLTALMILGLRKRKFWGYGIALYLVTLSIVSNIVFPIGTNMSERFMYMPSYGFALCCAALLAGFDQRRLGIPVLIAITLAFSLKTITRNPVWKNNYTLFLTDVKTSKRSAKLLNAAGGELQTQSQRPEHAANKEQMIRESLGYLRQAIEIHPRYKLSYLISGNGHYYLKEFEQAITYFQNALKLDPDFADAQKNLSIAYRDAGRMYGQEKGDLVRAIDYLERAYKELPEDYETVHLLGVSYGVDGQHQKAVQMLTKGTQISPDNATAFYNLGLAYQRIGDVAQAQKNLDRAVELDPEILKRRTQRKQN